MSRKNLCIIVIFCTISCVCIMLNDLSNYKSINYQQSIKEVHSIINTKEDSKVDNKKQSQVINEKKEEEIKNIQDEKVTKHYGNLSSSNKKKLINHNKDNSINNADNSYTAVFKVSQNDIINTLSFSDKIKIFMIAAKLSAIDYAKSKTFIQMGDVKGVINVMKLLKEKLSMKDYDNVKEVAGKFLNMDMVENLMSK